MDYSMYFQFFFSLVFVLSLLGLAAFAYKKYGGFGPGMKPNHMRRLKLIEILHLDQRKKMVLVQHDNQEHLILIGQGADTIISTSPAKPSQG